MGHSKFEEAICRVTEMLNTGGCEVNVLLFAVVEFEGYMEEYRKISRTIWTILPIELPSLSNLETEPFDGEEPMDKSTYRSLVACLKYLDQVAGPLIGLSPSWKLQDKNFPTRLDAM